MTTTDGRYVPDEEDVRTAYALEAARDTVGDTDYRAIPEARAEFDRFLTRIRQEAAREALDGLLAHAEERCGLSKSHRARDDWNAVAGATQDYRDTHYPKTEDQT